MTWVVARREIFSNILTLRFLIGFVLCLVLIVSSTYILVYEYAARLKSYDDSSRENINGVKERAVFARFSATLDRPPSKLSFMCIGSDRRMGNVTEITFLDVPVEAMGGDGGDPLMIVFPSLDMILIIQVILSLLALLFAYDTISGERERGTLAQVLSSSVPRHQLLIGKFVGGMMSVAIPLLVGLLAGLIMVWFSGNFLLDAGDWVRLGLIVFTSLLYIPVFFTLGMLISSLTRRSATSLILLLFLWVALSIIVPNMGPYMAKQIRPIQDRSVVDNQALALRSELQKNLYEYAWEHEWRSIYPNVSQVVYQSGGYESGGYPYPYEIYYAPKETLRWYLAGVKYRVSQELQYADNIWVLYQEYNKDLERQLSLARFLSRISPAWTYYNASAILSGTDVGNYLRFMDQARKYRQNIIDYAGSKGVLSTLRYFTRMRMEDAPTIAEAEEMVKGMGLDEYRKKMMEYTKDAKPLDDIPLFQYKPEGIAESFLRALPDLAILAILNVILFMLAHVSFMRGGVR